MRSAPSKCALGIDFGGTSIKFGVVHEHQIVSAAPAIQTSDFGDPKKLLDEIVDAINQVKTDHPEIEAIGIGVPGFVNFSSGTIHHLTNVPGWINIPLRNLVRERVGLPVVVDNDANCMAVAEWKFGAGKGKEHLLCITLGTGVGGGIISHGNLLRGANSITGELGQTSIDFQGHEGTYGNIGSLEKYIGHREITSNAVEVYTKHGEKKSAEDCSTLALAKAAEAGDSIAQEIWHDVAEKLATALMNACWLLNPECIVIGGGVAEVGKVLFEPLTKSLKKQLHPALADSLEILPAHFGKDAGIIGAASLALLDEAV